ncbi:MAG: rhodanese-like domain-containing protein [Burkholderiales bacterium]
MQQLSATELQAWLSDPSRPAPSLLDVRDPWEHAIAMMEGATALPLSRLAAGLGDLDKSRDWVVVCHHGMRSFQAAMFLERSGFARVANLAGGIDAWAREVDTSMARY